MESLIARLDEALPAPIRDRRPLGGGSINDAWQLELENGDSLFLKTHGRPPAGFFEAEAAGLRAMANTATVRVPAVVAVDEAFLVLEWLEGSQAGSYWTTFGEQLAAMHSHTNNRFGFDRDNFCGLTPQPNPWMEDGFRFFAQARLLHQGRLARDSGRLERADINRLETLAARLDRWIPEQPASLIHGDLWGGNAHTGPNGEPVLIDPATHYGWPEADLAMTTMFGRFHRDFYEAYLANGAVERDWEERIPLYNLYHELNHLNLFGGPYGQAVRRTLERFV